MKGMDSEVGSIFLQLLVCGACPHTADICLDAWNFRFEDRL